MWLWSHRASSISQSLALAKSHLLPPSSAGPVSGQHCFTNRFAMAVCMTKFSDGEARNLEGGLERILCGPINDR